MTDQPKTMLPVCTCGGRSWWPGPDEHTPSCPANPARKQQPDKPKTAAGWCWFCGARSQDYCKGGDEQGRCRFNDNPSGGFAK